MPTPMNVRVADRKDLSALAQGDFVVRNRNPSLKQVYILCFLPLFIVVVSSFMIYHTMLYGGMVCVLVGIVTLFFALQAKKHQRTLNSSEFLNALLASALTYDHAFCAIVKDGNIIYLDKGFQKTFPEFTGQPERTLAALFDLYKPAPEGRQKLLDVIGQNIHASVAVLMENGDERRKSELNFFIDPIKRPGGFVLLRGK